MANDIQVNDKSAMSDSGVTDPRLLDAIINRRRFTCLGQQLDSCSIHLGEFSASRVIDVIEQNYV